MSQQQNHYHVLGVSPGAPAADIKRAYRRLATQLHPDKHGGSAQHEEQFKAVAAAYRVLGDAGRRAHYDFQLQQAARRAEEQRRQQAARAHTTQVYGAPVPPPQTQPLRTRRPAGSRERHYQRIPRQQMRFNRRDWLWTGALLALFALFSWSVKVVMDRVSASGYLDDAQQAYARREWSRASSFVNEALVFRPDYPPALALRGRLYQQLGEPAAACADYEAALLDAAARPNPQETAALLLRLGQCQAQLRQAAAAELSFCRALVLDSALTDAYLARGENRLLELHQPRPALADLNRGLAQRRRAAAGAAPPAALQLHGVALASLGRYAEARADYLQVLEQKPKDGRIHFLLGRLAQQEGDGGSACEFFRRAVALGYDYAQPAYAECAAD